MKSTIFLDTNLKDNFESHIYNRGFERNNSIAGRDIYDIHHFFMNAYDYNKENLLVVMSVI